MTKTINIIETLKVAQVPKSNLLPEVEKLLEDKESFVDNDKSLSETMYATDIFVELLNNKLDTMSAEAEAQLDELHTKLASYDYVMFTVI